MHFYKHFWLQIIDTIIVLIIYLDSFPQICNLKNSRKPVTQVNKVKFLRDMYVPTHSGTHFSQLGANTEIWGLPWATLRCNGSLGNLLGHSISKMSQQQTDNTNPSQKQASKQTKKQGDLWRFVSGNIIT